MSAVQLTEVWQEVATLCAVSVAVGGLGVYVFQRGGKETRVSITASTAQNHAATALKEVQTLREEFHRHEVFDTQQFAELKATASEAIRAVVSTEARLSKSIDDLRNEIRGMRDEVVKAVTNGGHR